MAIKKLVIALNFFLLLVISNSAEETEETSLAKDILKTSVDFSASALSTLGIPVVGDAMKLLHQQYDDREGDYRKKVLNMFSMIDKKLDRTESVIFGKIDEQTVELALKIQLNDKLNEMEKLSSEVENLHAKFVKYLNSEKKFENETLIWFAEKNINSDLVARIYQVLRGPRHESERIAENFGLLELLANALNTGSSYFCSGYSTSPQQTLVNYYWRILSDQKQAYIMTLFSYSILIQFKRNDHNYANDVKLYHEHSLQKLIESAAQLLKTASIIDNREYWRCNPVKHVEDVTYLQATNTLQAFVQTAFERKYLFYNRHTTTIANMAEAKGKLHNFRIEVCESEHSNNSRLYDFIKVEKFLKIGFWELNRSTNIYGAVTECETKRLKVVQELNDDIPIVSIGLDKNNDADRYFDLRPVFSNITNGKVVTGVRFVKKNKIFRIQIQQGELMPYGRVNQSTVEWKKLDNLNLQNADYDSLHALNADNLAIEFGDFSTTDVLEIMTGVFFALEDGRLIIGAMMSSFNLETGDISKSFPLKLLYSRLSNSINELKLYKYFTVKEDDFPYWNFVNEYGGFVASEYLNQPDLPTSSNKSIPLSLPDQYVKFTFSNMKKDAAQSTLPFFDSQDVKSQPAVPLQGIGLFLKGEKGFAGFLTLKIKTFDYFHMMKNLTTYQNVNTDDWLQSVQNSNYSTVNDKVDNLCNVVAATTTAPSVDPNHTTVKDQMDHPFNVVSTTTPAPSVATDDRLFQRHKNSIQPAVKDKIDDSFNVVSTTTPAPSVTSNHATVKDQMDNHFNVVSTTTSAPSVIFSTNSAQSTFEKEYQIKSVVTYAILYNLFLITTVLLVVCALHICKRVKFSKFRRNV